MPSDQSQVVFKTGTIDKYNQLPTKDDNTVYFITDTCQLFIGSTEYTRPIKSGSSLPESFTPTNSLFYNTVTKVLYMSSSNSWIEVANFYTHPIFEELTLGPDSNSTLTFNGTFKVPSITTDSQGHVVTGKDITFTLPSAPTESSVQVIGSPEESQNVVAKVEKDQSSTTGIKITYGQVPTLDEFNQVKTTADSSMPKSGGEFTGHIVVPDATSDNQATNLKIVKSQISDAVGKITQFDLDLGPESSGYDTLESLKQAHPKGTKGVFYAVKNPNPKDSDKYISYIWSGTDYELIGSLGGVDLSAYLTKDEASSQYVSKTTTINGNPLSDNITINDISGNSGTSDKLKTPRTIELTGAVTGTAIEFDGSKNISINTTSVNAGNITGKVQEAVLADHSEESGSADKLTNPQTITLTGNASGSTTFDGSAPVSINVTVSSSTKANQDSQGRQIDTTYATKDEVKSSKLVWGVI